MSLEKKIGLWNIDYAVQCPECHHIGVGTQTLGVLAQTNRWQCLCLIKRVDDTFKKDEHGELIDTKYYCPCFWGFQQFYDYGYWDNTKWTAKKKDKKAKS
jgi:hypothetical protein